MTWRKALTEGKQPHDMEEGPNRRMCSDRVIYWWLITASVNLCIRYIFRAAKLTHENIMPVYITKKGNIYLSL